ncbi:Holliday junction resolvase RecU [Leuconostocaceae bacterium ESL0723]|nr:Holliday junction resolvase RecU [Leuconostocaceae bacterium ESL0723]
MHQQSSAANAVSAAKLSQRGMRYGRRGMGLEDEINLANEYYLANHLAVIHKKPTPVTIVGVDYPARSAAKITEAYFQKPSTTDYNGVYQGRYLDFDAKETRNKTSFPMKNFHAHQIEHLAAIIAQGGIGFVIIKFSALSESYLYAGPLLIRQWQEMDGRHSIPYQQIAEAGYLIPAGLNPSLDYLKVVDQLIADWQQWL